jgi:hypothetical protein
MPISNDQTALCNVALAKIGAQSITAISDTTSASAIACSTNFNLCYQELSRLGRWNCLLTTGILTEVTQTPLPWSSAGGVSSITATAWAINTVYAPGVYVTFGGYYYLVMYAYTSTNNFLNDLTTGALTQTDTPTSGNTFGLDDGSQYPSGWAHQFLLPSDFLLLAILNDSPVWDFGGEGSDDYELMAGAPTYPIATPPANKVPCLFCDAEHAVVQYVPNQPDTTQWDPLFANCFTLKLAATISTTLRQDGGRMETELIQAFDKALRTARARNGGERQARRFNPIPTSLFNQSRYIGLNN